MAANGDRGSLVGVGERTARISGDGYILKIQNCTFQMVDFMVCKLYLNSKKLLNSHIKNRRGKVAGRRGDTK